MKSEQVRLYEHYLNLSINGKDDIQRTNCLKYANEILKSYPELEVKEEPMAEVIIEEGIVKEIIPIPKDTQIKPKRKKK